MSDVDRSGKPNRRRVILSLAALGIFAWGIWPRLAGRFVGPFDFEVVDDPPGFRRLAGGQISSFPSPFFGLDTEDAVDISAQERAARSSFCTALFGGRPADDVVPIASFSDYYCPYCRVLTEKLTTIEEESNGGVQITWHEWPIFGETSDFAARAALAADMQDGYLAFHRRLMRSGLIPTERYMIEFAREIGADPEQLLADMKGPVVASRLLNTKAVAQILRLVGTPSLVIGRTIVVGSVSDAFIRALVEEERREGPMPAC